MEDKRIDQWQKAKRDREVAEEWNDLPDGRKYQNDNFDISIAHCSKPKLTRAGQQSCRGKNYWETAEGFNSAILEYVVHNWSAVYPKVLDILKKREADHLNNCQSYVDEMQEIINKAEGRD